MHLLLVVLVLLIGSTRCPCILGDHVIITNATRHTWSYRIIIQGLNHIYWLLQIKCVHILVLNILQILCFLSKLWCCDRSWSVFCWCKALHMLLGSNLRLDFTWLHCRANRNSWLWLFTSALALVIVINKCSRMHLLLLELIVSLN